jgi:hypothetical protein
MAPHPQISFATAGHASPCRLTRHLSGVRVSWTSCPSVPEQEQARSATQHHFPSHHHCSGLTMCFADDVRGNASCRPVFSVDLTHYSFAHLFLQWELRYVFMEALRCLSKSLPCRSLLPLSRKNVCQTMHEQSLEVHRSSLLRIRVIKKNLYSCDLRLTY